MTRLPPVDRDRQFPGSAGDKSFPTTCWTIILHAGQRDSSDAKASLEYLCRTYWYPLYAFVRHRGYSAHDAQDLTQAFFAQLLEKQPFDRVGPEKGKFRSFLLAALKNFLANERDKANAHKRGGNHTILSLEINSAESRYSVEPSHDSTPEKAFDRQWALALLDHVLANLRAEYKAGGDEQLFEELKESLTGGSDSYAAIAARLGRTEGAIKVAAHRLRHRYRDLLRAEVAQTVDGDMEEELQHLMVAVRA